VAASDGEVSSDSRPRGRVPSLAGLGRWIWMFPALTCRATVVPPCGLGEDVKRQSPPMLASK